MDAQTRALRRRNKAQQGKRGELPSIGARSYGRKNAVERRSNRQCDHIDGGKRFLIFKTREDKSRYAVEIIKGGTRCPRDVLAGSKCADHIGVGRE